MRDTIHAGTPVCPKKTIPVNVVFGRGIHIGCPLTASFSMSDLGVPSRCSGDLPRLVHHQITSTISIMYVHPVAVNLIESGDIQHFAFPLWTNDHRDGRIERYRCNDPRVMAEEIQEEYH